MLLLSTEVDSRENQEHGHLYHQKEIGQRKDQNQRNKNQPEDWVDLNLFLI